MRALWTLGATAAAFLAMSLSVEAQPLSSAAQPLSLQAQPLSQSTRPAPLAAQPDDDCGCDPPPVRLSQTAAPATASLRIPATMTVLQPGGILHVEADTIEGVVDEGPIEARGGVVASYGPIRLQADMIRFDSRSGEGLASGSVDVSSPPYRLLAESLTFNAKTRTAEAHQWRAWVEGEVQGEGRLLTMDASRSVAYDSSFSPCLADDPGYRFSFSRFEWTPRSGGSTISGWNALVRLSDVPVFWFPYFQANLPLPKLPKIFEGPEIRSQLQAGYDEYDGFYVSTSDTYELAPGWTGRVPVRATTQRGITVGVEQRLPLEFAEGRLDAMYTTPFPGNSAGLGAPNAFLPGPRANLSLFRDVPGGTGVMSVGYRAEIGNPFRIGPFAPLSNTPVSRLPEFSYFGVSRALGPIGWSPTARLGYLIEEGGASSPLAELALNAGGPEFWLPGRIRVTSFGSLRGNAYRELTASELASGDLFLGRMARGVAQAGLSASTEWLGFRMGGTAEMVRVGASTPANRFGTPFGHDRIDSQDRLAGTVRRHLFGPFSAGADAVLARPYGPSGPGDWVQSDMGLNLSYQVGCVSVHFNYKPLIKGWGFSYAVTSF
ncbi:organic solvent tolerance protein [compost metagenome]